MAILAVFLVPLALLHATTAYKPPIKLQAYQLNVAATDAINDVIRYYNNHFKNGPPYLIKDVHVPKVVLSERASVQNITASEGKLVSNGLKLASKLADVSLATADTKEWKLNLLTANFPVTVKDLKLQYDKLHVVYVEDDRPTKAPTYRALKGVPTGAVKVLIGKNKFALQLQTLHIYKKTEDGNTFSGCVASITNAVPEQFEVKNVTISGMVDTYLEAELDVLANTFKAQLTEETDAAEIIETLFKERAGSLFRYCVYYSPRRFESYLASFHSSLPVHH